MSNVVILVPREEPVTPCDKIHLRVLRDALQIKVTAMEAELSKDKQRLAVISASLGEHSFTAIELRKSQQH